MSPLEPGARRPYMPGYGTKRAAEGSGLLPWSWAADRLSTAKNYWVVTLGPDGFPHSTPVWGIWDGTRLSFTCAVGSRKSRNLRRDPRCSVSTEDASNPVILEGTVELRADAATISALLQAMNKKYESHLSLEFLDPAVNSLFQLNPVWAFGLRHDDFEGSPTRCVFES